jgi:Sec-independent protein secretion pathway component TatC
MSLSKNPFVEFLKATLAGGVLFLLPVVLVLIVLHRAMSYASARRNRFRIYCL